LESIVTFPLDVESDTAASPAEISSAAVAADALAQLKVPDPSVVNC